MNIRIVRRRHGEREVLAELPDVPSSELPEKDDMIWLNGSGYHVLTIIKSYEKSTLTHSIAYKDPLYHICWFEVDIT